MTDEFYVGYAPTMPVGLRVFVRRFVASLGLLAIALAIVLLSGQMPFANSSFEFGQSRTFEGILETTPYPIVLVKQARCNRIQLSVLAVSPRRPGKTRSRHSIRRHE